MLLLYLLLLAEVLEIFFFMYRTIYPFTWQLCQCHNLNYHSNFPDGIFFSNSGSEEFTQVEGSHLNTILKSISVLQENKRQDAACAGMG